jgi:hypothetical protein
LLCASLAPAACGEGFKPGHPKFAEVPETSGFAFRHELPNGTLDNSMKSAMGGVALVDFDDDGKIDVFCVNGGWADDPHLVGQNAVMPAKPATCRLYRNLGGLKFEDVTEKAGVGFAGFALGACVGDFDGDGLVDIFVSAYGMPALYRNRGDGTFEDVAANAGVKPGWYAGATFLDYDRDGNVDLFASQYVDPSEVAVELNFPGDFAGPAVYKPQPARLYRGKGDGTFEDVTARTHVGTAGKGMGVLASDVDVDGFVDVIVANDGVPNFVWRNQGDGTFADAAGRFGIAYGADGEARASMGVTASDVDGDGRLDYLIPDTAGGSVYVASGVAEKTYFIDRAPDWGFRAATHGQIGWADVGFDADNDGRLDVWKTHGELRNVGHWDSQWPKLVMNHGRNAKGGAEFVYEPPPEKREYEGAEAFVTGRGGVAADFDDDGREDLLLLALNGRARIFHNATAPAGHWVRVRLVGKKPNTSALGARLTALVGKSKVVREVSGATGYISAPDLRLSIGLGGEERLVEVVVRWPGGKMQRVGVLAADKDHVIREE